MNNIWPYRWFGFWKEQGEGYEMCPSIYDFRTRQAGLTIENSDKLCDYLSAGKVVVSTGRLGFPCLITGEVFSGAMSIRTDGLWVWQDDLAHYVKKHDVQLPRELIDHIKTNEYLVPGIEVVDKRKLEFPH